MGLVYDNGNPDNFHVSPFSRPLWPSVIVCVSFFLGASLLCVPAYLDEITRSNKLFLAVHLREGYIRGDTEGGWKKKLRNGSFAILFFFLFFHFSVSPSFCVRVACHSPLSVSLVYLCRGPVVTSWPVKGCNEREEATRGKERCHFSLASFEHVGSLI